MSGTSFGTKAGFVLDAERPVCVLAESFDEAQRACQGLHAVAFFDLVGYVLGGGAEITEWVTIDEVEALMASGAEVIDVREEEDVAVGTIPGSRNIPYRVMATETRGLTTERMVITFCDTGPRAAVAASILRASGYDARPVIGGGMSNWRGDGGRPV